MCFMGGLIWGWMKLETAAPASVVFTTQSVLGELPGYSLALDLEVSGAEVEAIFKESPELPGIVLLRDGEVAGAISQTHFYKVVSRGFGREIYYPRPVRIVMEEMETPVLILRADCPIQQAVDLCLARPENQIYEPFLVVDQESGRFCLCSFHALLLASSRISTLRNRQMEQILNSITDGLLVIDRDYVIGGEYSRALETIFEREDLAGKSLPALLGDHLDPALLEQTVEYLEVLFNPRLIDGLIRSINPIREIKALFPGQVSGAEEREKHFAVNFERIRTQGEISQILVRVEDITRRVTLARELAAQQEQAEDKLKLLLQIFQVDPAPLNRFLRNFDTELREADRLLASPESGHEAIHDIFRRIHGLKGDAGQLQLGLYENRLHRFEDQLAARRSQPRLGSDDFAALRDAMSGLHVLSDQLQDAVGQLQRLAVVPRISAASGEAPANGHAAGNGTPSPQGSQGPIAQLTRLLPDLARRTGKQVVFHAGGEDAQIPEIHHGVLGEVLPHLARNSVAHGIEVPEERRRCGKPPEGVVQVAVNRHPHAVEIIFQDDGCGLDPEKLRKRAREIGLAVHSDQEASQVIFHPGFSTADHVTEIAGRGVGMDAVRAALQRCGGEIIPHSQPGVYCAFQILLPLPGAKGGSS